MAELTQIEGALLAHVSEWGARDFEWGTTDCCQFVADWWHKVTDDDSVTLWRGTYDSLDGALNIIDAAGGLVALVSEVTGVKARSGKSAQAGDICLVRVHTDLGETVAMGIAASDGHIALRARAGVMIFQAVPSVVWPCPKR